MFKAGRRGSGNHRIACGKFEAVDSGTARKGVDSGAAGEGVAASIADDLVIDGITGAVDGTAADGVRFSTLAMAAREKVTYD